MELAGASIQTARVETMPGSVRSSSPVSFLDTSSGRAPQVRHQRRKNSGYAITPPLAARAVPAIIEVLFLIAVISPLLHGGGSLVGRCRERRAPPTGPRGLPVDQGVQLGHQEALRWRDEAVTVPLEQLTDATAGAAGQHGGARHPGVEGSGQNVAAGQAAEPVPQRHAAGVEVQRQLALRLGGRLPGGPPGGNGRQPVHVGWRADHQQIGLGDQIRGGIGHRDEGHLMRGAQAVRDVAGDDVCVPVHRLVNHKYSHADHVLRALASSAAGAIRVRPGPWVPRSPDQGQPTYSWPLEPSAIASLFSPVTAGPTSTAPVLALNCDPWHGQAITCAVGSYPTVQPACGHTASKATNWPERGWITIEGSPVAGSLNEAACPTGTSAAGPMAVPEGTVPGLGAGELPGPTAVAGTGAAAEGRLDGPALPAVPPASLPRPAASPPMARLRAATAAVVIPRSTTSRRRTAGAAGPDRRACRRAAAACWPAQPLMTASSDRTEPESASSRGVQANANTMSAPV